MLKFIPVWIVAAVAPLAGCDEWRRPEGTPVSHALQRPGPVKPASERAPDAARPRETERDAPPRQDARPSPSSGGRPPRSGGDVIATVDGVPVPRTRLVDFLMQSHGAAALEQIVTQERVEREAAERGIEVSERDIEAEYDRWLRHLTNPELAGAAAPDAPVDRAEGERLLERVLAARNMSRVEYMAGVRRNAYLRKIVQHDSPVTDEQLEAEFRNTYGERVSVRHIQLATAADAERVVRELAVPGTDFAEMARRYSANPDTAPSGGRLRDFSRDDPDVPELLRAAAFDLELGAHSDPVRIGEWFQIVKLEARHAAADHDMASVRGELEERILIRTSEPAMRELHRKVLEEAKVEIADPVLAAEYEKKHPTFAGRKQGN